jgi:hypothetical protein
LKPRERGEKKLYFLRPKFGFFGDKKIYMSAILFFADHPNFFIGHDQHIQKSAQRP